AAGHRWSRAGRTVADREHERRQRGPGRERSRPAGARREWQQGLVAGAARVIQPEAVTSHGDDVLPVWIDFGEAVAQAAYERVDCLFAHALTDSVGPDGFDDGIASTDAPGVDVQQFEQAILRRAERRVNLDIANEHPSRLAVEAQPAADGSRHFKGKWGGRAAAEEGDPGCQR